MWSLMYNCALISTKINACKSKKFEKIFDTKRKLSIDLENWNDSKDIPKMQTLINLILFVSE